MAMPGTLDLDLYEGDDNDFALDLEVSEGVPADLAGLTGKAQIRTTAGATDLVAEFVVTPDPAVPGRVRLELPGTGTRGKAGDHVWDLQFSPPVRTYLAGAVHIEPDVSV